MLRLYTSPTTPFGRKVEVLIHETGQSGQIETVQVAGNPLDSAQMPVAQNPLGKIPVLERDDGPALYDSRVICRYLDERTGGRLYPATPGLWDTLTLEATADGILDAAILMVYESRLRPEAIRFEPWVEAQWAKVARALDVLEARWLGHLNRPVDMGQIAVGCALSYLDFRHGARGWRRERAGLARWFDGFADRDSMKATEPRG